MHYYYGSGPILSILAAIVVSLIVLLVFLRIVPVGLWITSLVAGVHVSIASLVGMRLRRIQRHGLSRGKAVIYVKPDLSHAGGPYAV